MVRITSLKLLHVQSLLCIFYISSFIFGLFVPLVVDLLSLPFSSIYDIYRLFTFHLVTDEICVFIFTILAIFIYAKLVFHVWSRTEILFFYWFVNTSAGILAIFPEIFFGNNIFVKRINGNSAFLSSVLIVLIQLSMDQSLVKIRGFNFKSQYGLPAMSITFLCLWTVGFIRLSSGILFCYGILCSWCYLRFLQRHPQGRRGDYRSVFAFASWLSSGKTSVTISAYISAKFTYPSLCGLLNLLVLIFLCMCGLKLCFHLPNLTFRMISHFLI
ncbi:unnamed protein product [Schistosoma margrebowiei]|uniref:Uncharacterized protein n=1 Tax=Schistosoma margrebowiei TaxID=48269 RepID=A0AA85AB00_9TREM|nr:unnamed protein product [Schistosoma margrebowiei]